MQVGGVLLVLTLIMHEQAFGDYLTDHPFSLWKVWAGEQATSFYEDKSYLSGEHYCTSEDVLIAPSLVVSISPLKLQSFT